MLIGKRWVENTRLKILNGFLAITGAWGTFPETISTNLSERGFLVGFHQLFAAAAGTYVDFQILFDGHPPHEGYLRAGMDQADRYQANIQPTSMRIPSLDIPPNTEVSVRARVVGNLLNMYVDLYAVVYYMKDWEAAIPGVCFPTDVAPPGQV